MNFPTQPHAPVPVSVLLKNLKLEILNVVTSEPAAFHLITISQTNIISARALTHTHTQTAALLMSRCATRTGGGFSLSWLVDVKLHGAAAKMRTTRRRGCFLSVIQRYYISHGPFFTAIAAQLTRITNRNIGRFQPYATRTHLALSLLNPGEISVPSVKDIL